MISALIRIVWNSLTSSEHKRKRRAGIASVAIAGVGFQFGQQIRSDLIAMIQRHEIVEDRVHETIVKTADERNQVMTEMLREIRKDTRETRELALTLLKEHRTEARAQLIPVKPSPRITNLSPGLFPAWYNRGNESRIQSKE
jgi:hypothetical protein